MCEGKVELNLSLSPNEAAYLWSKVTVIVFPLDSWDVCPVCVGDDGVEVCYCDVYVGNWNVYYLSLSSSIDRCVTSLLPSPVTVTSCWEQQTMRQSAATQTTSSVSSDSPK